MATLVDLILTGFTEDALLATKTTKQFNQKESGLLKAKLIAFFQFKMGGAKRYIGKPLGEVHQHMGITDALFEKACLMMVAKMKLIDGLDKAEILEEF